MFNQQMLDYIKQQTQQGISQEQIKNSLLSSDWELQDIQEGFKNLNLPFMTEQNSVTVPKPTVVKWKIVAITILVIVVIFSGIYFGFQKFSKQGLKAPTAVNTVPEKNIETQILDCGTVTNFQNFDCFVNAAQNCSPAKVTSSTQIDLLGSTMKATSFYEIKGQQDNKCLFYIKTTSNDTVYGQELIQKMLDEGFTEEQIKKQQQESSKMAQSKVNLYGLCKFKKTSDLVSLLNNWKGGNFSTNDFQEADCKGEYFGQPEQLANTSKTITDEECKAQNGNPTLVGDKGAACFKNQTDLGTIVGSLKVNDKYPQCCVSK